MPTEGNFNHYRTRINSRAIQETHLLEMDKSVLGKPPVYVLGYDLKDRVK